MRDRSGIGIVWFRRDLRLSDNRVLRRAVDECDRIIPLFVVDDRFWNTAGANRRWFLAGCLADLDQQLGGRLVVRHGDPALEIADLVRRHGATRLYRADDAAPAGRRRDAEVDDTLFGAVTTVVADQPYAVELGSLRTTTAEPYRMYTPYWRRWREAADRETHRRPRVIHTVDGVASDGIPDVGPPTATEWRPDPSERAAHRAVDRFLDGPIHGYRERRNRPAVDGTSRLGPYLKFGCVHPRQILGRLDIADPDHEAFARELAWRDFYADVLYAWPESSWSAFDRRLSEIELDHGPDADVLFAAWTEGRTGFPIVDAGMRQLVGEGYMHNRVRMIAASVLVKDFHIDWTRGARFFLHHLYDGDLASNNHGWQWVAGTGTDAAPYFRVFNPARQGERFDPVGAFVRRWVPELRGVRSEDIHEPAARGARPLAYPAPVVDHATERGEALRRYSAATTRR